jgi:hypothetical protein
MVHTNVVHEPHVQKLMQHELGLAYELVCKLLSLHVAAQLGPWQLEPWHLR